MANPQPDKFTKISTELLEAICRLRIPGGEMRVLFFIIRKTYGFKKKGDYIPQIRIADGTESLRQNVNRALQKLKEMNIILVIKYDSYKPSYISIN